MQSQRHDSAMLPAGALQENLLCIMRKKSACMLANSAYALKLLFAMVCTVLAQGPVLKEVL